MIIRNARVLTFDSANRVLDSGAVEILPDGSIGQVKDTLAGCRGTAPRTLLVRSHDQERRGYGKPYPYNPARGTTP